MGVNSIYTDEQLRLHKICERTLEHWYMELIEHKVLAKTNPARKGSKKDKELWNFMDKGIVKHKRKQIERMMEVLYYLKSANEPSALALIKSPDWGFDLGPYLKNRTYYDSERKTLKKFLDGKLT